MAMYTPLPDWDSRTPYFGASLFAYDPKTDTYRCPNGQTLRRDHAKYTEGKVVYQAAPGICDACPLKAQCTSSKEGRRIHRNIDEDYLDRVRAHHRTEAYEKGMRKRKLWTEPLFAEAKLWHGLRRFRLRRLWRVNIEALMIAAAQNLKRLLRSHGRRLKPVSGMAVPVPFTDKDRPLPDRIVARIVVVARWRRGRGLVLWPASALCGRTHAAMQAGESERAQELSVYSLQLAEDLGDRSGVAEDLMTLAVVVCRDGAHEHAARLLGLAGMVQSWTRAERSTSAQASCGQAIASARAHLGDEHFSAQFYEGRFLTVREVITHFTSLGE